MIRVFWADDREEDNHDSTSCKKKLHQWARTHNHVNVKTFHHPLGQKNDRYYKQRFCPGVATTTNSTDTFVSLKLLKEFVKVGSESAFSVKENTDV